MSKNHDNASGSGQSAEPHPSPFAGLRDFVNTASGLYQSLQKLWRGSGPLPGDSASSPVPGMGAIPFDGGVSFRVWAPHAGAVFVVGEFNQWKPDRHPLAHEGNGYWSAVVDGARSGQQYKFRLLNGDRELYRIDPYAREVTHSVGNGIIFNPVFEWEGDDFRTPSWNEMTIYELHVGTFHRKPGQAVGSFDSACEKLSWLQQLGINTILVMPPMEFAGDFSWGYNTAHPFAIEQVYGGPQAFRRFVKAAHQHGIAVLVDVVYNHFGPGDLDLWQFDGWSENGKGGSYFYQDWRSHTPWGDTRPDYGRPEVRQYIRDNALMWLEAYHCDGLRFDATAYIRNVAGSDDPGQDIAEGWELLRWINSEIKARQPWKISIAEDLRSNPVVTAPLAEGGLGFDAQWDAVFVHPVREAIITYDDAHRDVQAVADAILHKYNGNAFARVIYTESHDEVANGKQRVPSEIWSDNPESWWAKKRSTLGAAIVFTAPGIPMIFQGQEFLHTGWFDDSRGLDWERLERFSGICELYKRLFRLRRNWHNETAGLRGQHVHLLHLERERKVVAFVRTDKGGPGDATVVVLNFTAQPLRDYWIDFPAAGLWRVRFNSDWNGFDAEFGNTFTADTEALPPKGKGALPRGSLNAVGPYTALILSQDRL
jgi:1,4-alpha-glucan branching enzyme